MTDFTTMSHAEIARFLVTHQSALNAEGITYDDVINRLATGQAILEVRSYGFAVIERSHISEGKFIPHLWVLFVDEKRRGAGLGRKFMKQILAKYSADFHMTLHCHGARRRKFFGQFGFRIESRDGEMRTMTTSEMR